MSDNGTPRRGSLIVAGVLGAVVLLCCGGGLWFFRPYLSDQYPASLITPAEAAGLSLSTDPNLEDAAAQMAAAMGGGLALRNPIAAVYLDPGAEERMVAVWGGTGPTPLRDPEAELDTAFQAADAGGFPVTDVHAVDPGEPGGVARCGQSSIDELPISICGWADHGSLVMGVFFARDVDQSATLLRDLRAEIRSS